MKTLKQTGFSILLLIALTLALVPSQTVLAALSGAGFWTPTTDMNLARDYHTATLLLDDTVLVVGGKNGGDSAELYDPIGETWQDVGALHKAREAHTATLLNDGKVLVAGGWYYGTYLASAELYDPITGSWTATSPLHTRRYFHTATRLANGNVLVVGGANNHGYLNSAELYNPVTGTWQVTGSLHIARYLHTATLLPNGKVLVAGGMDNSGAPAGAEVYDPATGKWTLTDALHNGRARHTATLLSNGKVLVAGGEDTNQLPLASAELYDPATGHWAITGSMSIARDNHAATQLPNGRVLVTGGWDHNLNAFSTAELYDPNSGTWVSTEAMGAVRFLHTATLLSNGKVLVVGGYDAGFFLSSAEVYTPGKIDQTITVTNPAPVNAVDGAEFTVSAIASSGLPVSYSADGVCTNVGATFTMTSSSGTCTVKYNQAGNADYFPAVEVTQTVKAMDTQTITVTNPAPVNAIYGTKFTVSATASSGLPVSYSAAGICTNVGATFTMTSSNGTCTVKYNQAGNADYLPALEVTQTVQGIATRTTFVSDKKYDGWILESTEISSMGGTMSSTAATLSLGDNAQKKQYRSILSFNTASLPDTAVITKITLKLKYSSVAPVGTNPIILLQGTYVDIRKGYFGTSSALQLTDFQAAANKTVGPFKPALSGNWYTLSLNNTTFSSINKLVTNGGLTQIRLRFKLDDNNNAIANMLNITSGNNATAANKPTLIIEYYVP